MTAGTLLQNLLGALTGAPSIFGWPALFYLRACKMRGERVGCCDAFLCKTFLYLLLPLTCSLGTAEALRSIASHWESLQVRDRGLHSISASFT